MRGTLLPVSPTDAARFRRVNSAFERIATHVNQTTSFLVTPRPLIRVSKAQAVQFADAFIDPQVFRDSKERPFEETFLWLDWVQVLRDESGVLQELQLGQGFIHPDAGLTWWEVLAMSQSSRTTPIQQGPTKNAGLCSCWT